MENLGAMVNAYTSREQMAFTAQAFDKDVPQMVDILADITQNQKLDVGAIEKEKDVIVREMQETNNDISELVFDHLHSVAFQGRALHQV